MNERRRTTRGIWKKVTEIGMGGGGTSGGGTTSANVGSYPVPIGSVPSWRRRKKKKKKVEEVGEASNGGIAVSAFQSPSPPAGVGTLNVVDLLKKKVPHVPFSQKRKSEDAEGKHQFGGIELLKVKSDAGIKRIISKGHMFRTIIGPESWGLIERVASGQSAQEEFKDEMNYKWKVTKDADNLILQGDGPMKFILTPKMMDVMR